MSEKTNIEWATSTGNPWIGCTKVSPGCKNCYAATMDEQRFSKTMGGTKENPVSHWGKGAPRVRTKAFWTDAVKWNRQAVCALCGELVNGEHRHGSIVPALNRPRIFPSLCDWLDNEAPIEWLADFLKLIHDTPNLDWLLLTKRPENWYERIHAAVFQMARTCGGSNPSRVNTDTYSMAWRWVKDKTCPTNVWLGVSVEDQKRADERIPLLLQIPAKVRFLSVEPLLSKINLACVGDQVSHPYKYRGNFWDLACENHCTWAGFEEDLISDPEQSDKDAEQNGTRYVCPTCHCESGLVERPDGAPNIDWVIVGGESGAERRDCGVEAICDVARQCVAASVPCFVKQASAFKSGQRGELPNDVWALKQFPHA